VPHCGKCAAALPWLVDISTADFQPGVAESPVPVLADFWAPWCGPCRIVAPAVEKIASDLAGKIKVAKINTDEQPGLQARFGVRSIPTLIIFEGGVEKEPRYWRPACAGAACVARRKAAHNYSLIRS
jgi:thioredoxin 2